MMSKSLRATDDDFSKCFYLLYVASLIRGSINSIDHRVEIFFSHYLFLDNTELIDLFDTSHKTNNSHLQVEHELPLTFIGNIGINL